jgi:hypothetical protein
MKTNTKSKWAKVGELKKSKQGKLYIEVKEDIAKGSYVMLKDPRASIAESVQTGRLTQEKGDEILSKIPDFVKYELIQGE